MMDIQRDSDLFCQIMSYSKDVAFEDIVGDEILLRERADDNEGLENLIFEYGLFKFVEEAFEMRHPELFKNTARPLVIKDMKKIVKYLKSEVIAYEDCCSEDDVINVKPAKKAHQRAKRIYKYLKG